MGEIVASIVDKRGHVTILDWVRSASGPVQTPDIAARFSMTIDDARAEMKRLERAGLVTSRLEPSCGTIGWPALEWTAVQHTDERRPYGG